MFGSNALTRPWAELVFYDSKLRECCKPIGENPPSWGYANSWTMAEAHSEAVERKKMEQHAAKMMDERIGQAVRQYSQQGSSASKLTTYYKPAVTQTQDQGNTSQNLITYPTQATAGNSTQSFQDRRRVIWCFRCTCNEHQTEDCHATTTRSGRRVALKKGDDGHFSLLDGTRFCYSYNKPGGANPEGNASKENTSAAPVAPPATVLASARPKPPWGVKTPLRVDRWRYFLNRLDKGQLTEPHLHVLHGIEHGFSYRSHITIEETCIYHPH
jgi:hypothetical protein